MNIKDCCFKLCKQIWDLESRDSIREFILSLDKADNDKNYFGYYAKKQCSQFMGYLIVDYKREEINGESIIKIPNISSSELNLIKKGHSIISYLNKKLISIFENRFKNITKILDPYCIYNYPNYEIDINELLDITIFNDLIAAFENSPLVKIINKTPTEFLIRIPEEQYIESVFFFYDKIDDYGVHESPPDFNELHMLVSKNSPEKHLTISILCLMSLRKIITNIDQLLYHAFLSNKLVTINNDNAISIVKDTHHMIGDGLTILVQPNGDEVLTQPGDMLLVTLEDTNITQLGILEKYNLNFNQNSGQTMEFDLRIVDNNLNPYYGLLNLMNT